MTSTEQEPDGRSSYFSTSAFWNVTVTLVKKAAFQALDKALILYYCLQDKDTPAWAKSVIIGAIGYLVMPLDAIPDVVPVAGFTDDLGVLATALATVVMYIKDEHREKALMISGKLKTNQNKNQREKLNKSEGE